MIVKLYTGEQLPHKAWLGWIEDEFGNALGYIREGTGEVVWMGGVQGKR